MSVAPQEFLHLRAHTNGKPLPTGGYTVTYKRHSDGQYSVSICQCNSNQRYDEKLGEKIADMRLSRGQFFIVENDEALNGTVVVLQQKLACV
jgi:hypothetical protein